MELIAEPFKKSDVGLIPSDWDVKSLGDCCTKITDGTHDTPKQVKTGVPFLTAIHVKESNIDFKGCYYLPEEVHKIIYSRCNPEKDDVLMVNIGAGVATTALVNVDYEFSLKNVALLKPDNSILIGSFLNYWQIQSKSKIIESISTGGAQPFLSLSQIGNLKIALPTKAEQNAIATALSDTDALIESLEELIAKMSNIKQGAMQKLLQPKEDWEVKKLGEVFTFYPTANYSKAEMAFDGEIGCMHYGLIHAISNTNYSLSNGVRYYVKGNKSEYELIKDGDVIMVDASEDFVGINKSVEVFGVGNRKFIPGLHTYLMRDENSVLVNNFRGLVLNSNGIKKQLLKLAVGMKVFGVSKVQLKEVLIPIPPIKEQTRIATILSDMDDEIAALETKLEKYRKVKLGMMQSLITGKIRLI